MSKRKAETTQLPEKYSKTDIHPLQRVLPFVLYYIPKPEYIIIRQVCKFTRELIQKKKVEFLTFYQTHNGNYWVPSLDEFFINYTRYQSDTLWEYLFKLHSSSCLPISTHHIHMITQCKCIKTEANYKVAKEIAAKNKLEQAIVDRGVTNALVTNGLKLLPDMILDHEKARGYYFWLHILTQVFKTGDLDLIDYYCDIYRGHGKQGESLIFAAAINSENFKSVVLTYNRLLSYDRTSILRYLKCVAFTNNIKLAKLVTYMCRNMEYHGEDDYEEMDIDGVEIEEEEEEETSILPFKNRPLIIKKNVSAYDAIRGGIQNEIPSRYKHITLDNYEEIIALLPNSAFDIDRAWELLHVGTHLIPRVHKATLLHALADVVVSRWNPVSMEMVKFFFERPGTEQYMPAFNYNDIATHYSMITATELVEFLKCGQVNIVRFLCEVGYYQKEIVTYRRCFIEIINGNRVELLQLFQLEAKDFSQFIRPAAGIIVRANETMKYLYSIAPGLVEELFIHAEKYDLFFINVTVTYFMYGV